MGGGAPILGYPGSGSGGRNAGPWVQGALLLLSEVRGDISKSALNTMVCRLQKERHPRKFQASQALSWCPEKLQAILEHAKEHPTRFIFGLSSTFFILLKVKKIFETENDPPTLPFSLHRYKRLEMIKTYRKNGSLPKVFKAKQRSQ